MSLRFLALLLVATSTTACDARNDDPTGPAPPSTSAGVPSSTAPSAPSEPTPPGEPTPSSEPTPAPPPAAVDTPVLPPNFLGITDAGPLSLGRSWSDAGRTLGDPCVTGPSIFQVRRVGGFSTGVDYLSNDMVANTLDIGSGLDPYGSAGLYDALPSVKAFIQAAAGPTGEYAMGLFVPLIGDDAGVLGLTNQEFDDVGDCHDRFVDSLEIGARLAVGLRMRFADADAYDFYQTHYTQSLRGLLQRDDLAWVSAALADKATVVLQAAQVGGDPSKLATIVDASGCTIGNLAACRETIAQVATYADTMRADLGPEPQSAADLGGWVPVGAALMQATVLPR